MVAPSTVSKVALRHGISRVPKYRRDELVDLIVGHLAGDRLNHDQREAIRRGGMSDVTTCNADARADRPGDRGSVVMRGVGRGPQGHASRDSLPGDHS